MEKTKQKVHHHRNSRYQIHNDMFHHWIVFESNIFFPVYIWHTFKDFLLDKYDCSNPIFHHLRSHNHIFYIKEMDLYDIFRWIHTLIHSGIVTKFRVMLKNCVTLMKWISYAPQALAQWSYTLVIILMTTTNGIVEWDQCSVRIKCTTELFVVTYLDKYHYS